MIRLFLVPFLLAAATVSAATYTEPATKLRFPDRLGPWRKTSVQTFPQKGLGVGIGYRHAAQGTVTIYIYNKGVPRIPTGARNTVVRREFATLNQEMAGITAQLGFKKVRKLLESDPSIRHNGKIATLLATAYSFENPKTRPASFLSYGLLTGYRNHFLKLRLSLPGHFEKTPAKGVGELRELVMAFLAANEGNTSAFWETAATRPARGIETAALRKDAMAVPE